MHAACPDETAAACNRHTGLKAEFQGLTFGVVSTTYGSSRDVREGVVEGHPTWTHQSGDDAWRTAGSGFGGF